MKKGDTVSVLDDTITGVVKAIHGTTVLIETSDGIDLNYQQSELIVIEDALQHNLFDMDVHSILSEKQSDKRKPKPVVKTGRKNKQPPMEVDLHIHNLVDNTKNLSNYEMLNIQI